MPDYQQTIGEFAELVRAGSGHEATSARRVAQMVQDLTGRDAPLRLLLGTDAVPLAQQAVQELARQRRGLARSQSERLRWDAPTADTPEEPRV